MTRFVRIGIGMLLGCATVVVVRTQLLGFESEFLASGVEGLVDLGLLGAAGFLMALSDREYFGLSASVDEPDRPFREG